MIRSRSSGCSQWPSCKDKKKKKKGKGKAAAAAAAAEAAAAAAAAKVGRCRLTRQTTQYSSPIPVNLPNLRH